MKFLSFLLLISVSFNVYFLTNNDSESYENQDELDQVSTSQAAIKNKPITEVKRQENLKAIKENVLEVKKDTQYEQLKETRIEEKNYINEDEVEKAKEAWKSSATEFMNSELELDQDKIDAYFSLEVERDRALSKFMQKRITDNGGDQFFYTLEDIVDENKINELYLNKLKALLGPDSYEDYKNFRNAYNKKIIESGEGFFLIEI